jgi:hypothetical protein
LGWNSDDDSEEESDDESSEYSDDEDEVITTGLLKSRNLNEVQGINPERIAKELHDAMDGIGTDEAQFFQTIQPTGRKGLTPEEQKQVRQAYLNLYDVDLCDRLLDDFSGSDLQRAGDALGCGEMNESITRDMSFMKHLIGYDKKTQ